MTRKILINAMDPEENRIAMVFDNKLDQFHIETAAKAATKGNIYKGIVTRVEPSLQAVFVDYGAPKNGFLQKNEIHPDYFQEVEKNDRSLFSLIKKGQEMIVQVTKDPDQSQGCHAHHLYLTSRAVWRTHAGQQHPGRFPQNCRGR